MNSAAKTKTLNAVRFALLLPTLANAQGNAETVSERQCWQQHVSERTKSRYTELTAVSFGNLSEGDQVASPFTVQLGIKGMGIAPAGKDVPKTGHHHLLIDIQLPKDPTAALPFSDNYVHFGKGQTNTLVKLAAGKHTLQLLFADHAHRPYFLFSPRVNIEVLEKEEPLTPQPNAADPNFQVWCKRWYTHFRTAPRPSSQGVYFVNLRDGDVLNSPFIALMSVDGSFVGAKAAEAAGTGYFVIDVLKAAQKIDTVDLSNGATQTEMFLPKGDYSLRLRMVDSGPGNGKIRPEQISVSVR